MSSTHVLYTEETGHEVISHMTVECVASNNLIVYTDAHALLLTTLCMYHSFDGDFQAIKMGSQRDRWILCY